MLRSVGAVTAREVALVPLRVRRTRARGAKLLPVLLTTLVLAACGGDDDADEGADTGAGETTAETTTAPELNFDLVIGDIVSLTGAENVFGPSHQAAADLAKAEIDGALEEAGVDVTVELEHADDETTPQGAVAAARRLVAADASCITGPLTSSSAIAVAEAVTVPEGVPNVATSASSIEISELEDEGLVFRLFPSDALQGPAVARVIAEEIGSDATLSLAARNDAFGEGFMSVFKPAWEELGGTAIGPLLYDPEAASLDSEAQQIVSGNADAYFVLDFPSSYAKLGAALLRAGNFSGDDLYVAGGQPAEIPSEVPFESMDGAVGTRPGVPQAESWDAFVELYEGTGGLPPLEAFAQNNFDATVLCFLAALQAGSNDPEAIKETLLTVSGPPGDKFTWQELPDAVEALAAGEDIDYDGISGEIDFDEVGDPTSAIYDVYKYIDGTQTVVGQYDVDTEELTITDPEAAGFGDD
jgi:ABC-type branched-subunit amino acid transport system substrate-binding protein